MLMQPKAFESSNIKDFCYDTSSQILSVTFHNDNTYNYQDVPISKFLQMDLAESKGAFLAVSIKGHFRYYRANGD